ncbi:MAG: hypothetical protein K5877_09945 [Lachnospiraceae bacterium]|nr:hypothetical protein [Lachnospiraceae bacterium]
MSDNIKELIGSIFSTAIKIVIGFIVVMFIRKYAILAYNYGYRVFTEPPVTLSGDGTNISVSIGEEHSALEVGKMLESKGLIRDGKLFLLQELVSENHGKIQPGKYDLNTTMTAEEMINVMAGIEEENEEDLLFNADGNALPFKSDEDEELLEASQEEQDEEVPEGDVSEGEAPESEAKEEEE